MAFLLAIPELFLGGEAAGSLFSFSRLLNVGSLFSNFGGSQNSSKSSNSSSGISTETILIGSVALGGIVILSVLSNSKKS